MNLRQTLIISVIFFISCGGGDKGGSGEFDNGIVIPDLTGDTGKDAGTKDAGGMDGSPSDAEVVDSGEVDANKPDATNDAGDCDCNIPNAEAECEDGTCILSACHFGFYNLNEDTEDGCEYNCGHEKSKEICDNIDNDCNSIIDDLPDFDTNPDHCGKCGNVCQFGPNSTPKCESKHCFIECDYGWYDTNGDILDGCESQTCVPTGDEICDNVDNNCNGLIDEGIEKDLLTRCGTMCIDCTADAPANHKIECTDGICADYGCLDGFIDEDGNPENGCEKRCTPTEDLIEFCDGIDNDCNSLTLDGADDPLTGQSCQVLYAKGECKEGIYQCKIGNMVCVSVKGSSEEICDGEDNDCDGEIDEGDLCEVGEACQKGTCVCVDECQTDSCADINTIKKCGNFDLDTCKDTQLKACDTGKICKNGSCCLNSCSAAGDACGQVPDGCGSFINCGCSNDKICKESVCVSCGGIGEPCCEGEVCLGEYICADNICYKGSPVPPTNVTKCYDNSYKEIACPGTAGAPDCKDIKYCGQDAQYDGRSKTYTAETIQGQTIVRDSYTGLDWMSNEDHLPTYDESVQYCESLTYAGFNDWRMPTVKEYLITFSSQPPDSIFQFKTDIYLWATPKYILRPYPYMGTEGGRVDESKLNSYFKDRMNVRCVRGIIPNTRTFIDLNYGIQDTLTKLIWQKTLITYRSLNNDWSKTLAYCEGLELGGFSDWRLPNINELISLVNNDKDTSDIPMSIENYRFSSSDKFFILVSPLQTTTTIYDYVICVRN